MIRQYTPDNYHSTPYSITVLRDPNTPLGPGILKAMCWNPSTDELELIDAFPVITGNQELDPAKYGGITPPMTWLPIEPFMLRSPDGVRPKLRMSRIIPANDIYANMFYPLRTWALPPQRNDPFMIHLGNPEPGASTGCIVVTQKMDLFSDLLSEMQATTPLVPIHVKNIQP